MALTRTVLRKRANIVAPEAVPRTAALPVLLWVPASKAMEPRAACTMILSTVTDMVPSLRTSRLPMTLLPALCNPAGMASTMVVSSTPVLLAMQTSSVAQACRRVLIVMEQASLVA